MADLLIRNLSPALRREIQERARKHGHTLSEEAKELIRQGLAVPEPPEKMGTFLFSLVPEEDRGDDLKFELRDEIATAPDFE